MESVLIFVDNTFHSFLSRQENERQLREQLKVIEIIIKGIFLKNKKNEVKIRRTSTSDSLLQEFVIDFEIIKDCFKAIKLCDKTSVRLLGCLSTGYNEMKDLSGNPKYIVAFINNFIEENNIQIKKIQKNLTKRMAFISISYHLVRSYHRMKPN